MGISREGSSSSDSGGGGGGVATVWGAATGCRVGNEVSCVGAGGLVTVAVDSVPCFFSTSGGMSVVLCLPVVQGGMERNSSKVRTRGLQHFQPSIM